MAWIARSHARVCISLDQSIRYAYETNNFDLLLPAMSDLTSLFMMFGAHDYAKAFTHQLALFKRMFDSGHPVYKAVEKLSGHFSQRKLEVFHGWLSLATNNAPVDNEYSVLRQATVLHGPFRDLKGELEERILTESERKRQKRVWETRDEAELVTKCAEWLDDFIDNHLSKGCDIKFAQSGTAHNVPIMTLKSRPSASFPLGVLAFESPQQGDPTRIESLWRKSITKLRENFGGKGAYNKMKPKKTKKANKKIHAQLKKGLDPDTGRCSYELLARELGDQKVAFDRTTSKAKSIREARAAGGGGGGGGGGGADEPPPKKRRKAAGGVAAATAAASSSRAKRVYMKAKKLCTHKIVEKLPPALRGAEHF